MDEDAIEGFERSVAASKRKRTAKSYAQGARKLEKFLDETGTELEGAPEGMMGNFVQWMSESERLEASSIKLFTIGARRYLDWKRGQGEEIPVFGKPDLPKVPEHIVEVLTRTQLRIFLGLVSQNITEPSRTALLLLPFCGLRSGEISELRLSHIGSGKDKNGKVHILFDFPGKGAKRRRVPVADPGKGILRSYLGDWRDEFGEKYSDNPFMFPGRNEGHISPRTLRDAFAFVRDRGKLGSALTPHILRKTYCTELIRAGFHISTVAEVMGHASINTTNKFYTHVHEEDLMETGNLSYQ